MDLGDYSESAEAAHLELGEVVAGHVLHHPAAGAHQSSVPGRNRAAEHVVSHGAITVTQRAGGGGCNHRADAPVGAARRIDGEPHTIVGQPPSQCFERRAGLDRRDQIGGAHRHDLLQRPGTHRKVGGRILRKPGASAFNPDFPAFLVRQAAYQRERVAGIRAGPGYPLGVPVDPGRAEQCPKTREDDVAHCRALFTACHSRQACTGKTLPGLARSAGSKTRRTARMAPRVWASKIQGM